MIEPQVLKNHEEEIEEYKKIIQRYNVLVSDQMHAHNVFKKSHSEIVDRYKNVVKGYEMLLDETEKLLTTEGKSK